MDLSLELECEGCLKRLIKVVVEWICQVLVLATDQLKLAQLSELKPRLKACQFHYVCKLALQHLVESGEQTI